MNKTYGLPSFFVENASTWTKLPMTIHFQKFSMKTHILIFYYKAFGKTFFLQLLQQDMLLLPPPWHYNLQSECGQERLNKSKYSLLKTVNQISILAAKNDYSEWVFFIAFLRLSKKMERQYLKTDHQFIFQNLAYVLNTVHCLNKKQLLEAQK